MNGIECQTRPDQTSVSCHLVHACQGNPFINPSNSIAGGGRARRRVSLQLGLCGNTSDALDMLRMSLRAARTECRRLCDHRRQLFCCPSLPLRAVRCSKRRDEMEKGGRRDE
jgi:hypothetical protein